MKTLLLDIETSPNLAYVWGLFKQNVAPKQIKEVGNIMCWAAKWQGERKVYFNSTHQSNQEEMLSEIHALIDEADAVMHYNGTSFDMPTLNREFLLHGMTPPSPYKQIDLYTTVKRQFRFVSNKLEFVSKQLGLDGKVSHEGFDLWVKCMQGDNKAWGRMKKYNVQDVKLLEEVYDRLQPWIKNHPNHGAHGEHGHVCPNCASDNLQSRGIARTSMYSYRRYRCNDCGKWSRGNENLTPKEKNRETLREIA